MLFFIVLKDITPTTFVSQALRSSHKQNSPASAGLLKDWGNPYILIFDSIICSILSNMAG